MQFQLGQYLSPNYQSQKKVVKPIVQMITLEVKLVHQEKQRKQFRTSVIVRNIYSEVLNIIQPIVISKLKKNNREKENIIVLILYNYFPVFFYKLIASQILYIKS